MRCVRGTQNLPWQYMEDCGSFHLGGGRKKMEASTEEALEKRFHGSLQLDRYHERGGIFRGSGGRSGIHGRHFHGSNGSREIAAILVEASMVVVGS